MRVYFIHVCQTIRLHSAVVLNVVFILPTFILLPFPSLSGWGTSDSDVMLPYLWTCMAPGYSVHCIRRVVISVSWQKLVLCNSKLNAYSSVVYTVSIKGTYHYLNSYWHSSSTYMWVSRLQLVREYINQFKMSRRYRQQIHQHFQMVTI